MGWGGIPNGKLMALAQQGFDAFVTVDQNLEYQQNLSNLRMGLITVVVPDNNIKYFKPIFPELRKAVESVRVKSSALSVLTSRLRVGPLSTVEFVGESSQVPNCRSRMRYNGTQQRAYSIPADLHTNT